MSESISRRSHPLLAWLLLALLVVFVVVFLVLPALARSWELDDQIDSGYRRLSKMREVAEATPEFVVNTSGYGSRGWTSCFIQRA